jgi:hypothetical protein
LRELGYVEGQNPVAPAAGRDHPVTPAPWGGDHGAGVTVGG